MDLERLRGSWMDLGITWMDLTHSRPLWGRPGRTQELLDGSGGPGGSPGVALEPLDGPSGGPGHHRNPLATPRTSGVTWPGRGRGWTPGWSRGPWGSPGRAWGHPGVSRALWGHPGWAFGDKGQGSFHGDPGASWGHCGGPGTWGDLWEGTRPGWGQGHPGWPPGTPGDSEESWAWGGRGDTPGGPEEPVVARGDIRVSLSLMGGHGDSRGLPQGSWVALRGGGGVPSPPSPRGSRCPLPLPPSGTGLSPPPALREAPGGGGAGALLLLGVAPGWGWGVPAPPPFCPAVAPPRHRPWGRGHSGGGANPGPRPLCGGFSRF